MTAATRSLRMLLGMTCAGVLLALPAVAKAAPFTVTNTNDSGGGSLRQAIEDAAGNAEADTITITATGTIALQSELSFDDELTIAGPGAAMLTVSGGEQDFPVFIANGGPSTISGITVADGTDFIEGPSDILASGGGIENNGSLTLDRIVVRNNAARAEATGVGSFAQAHGGGIANFGALTVRHSVISDNMAFASTDSFDSAAVAQGGGIWNENVITIDSSTLSGNDAITTTLATELHLSTGGGFHHEKGDATLTRSTITGNTTDVNPALPPQLAFATGGGVSSFTMAPIVGESLTITSNRAMFGANWRANAQFTNTIVADPDGAGENCDGSTISGGHNLEDGVSCGFVLPTDQSDTNPRLDPSLSDNGGPTPTLALLDGSPAIDAGIAAGGNADQRGFGRPSDLLTIANVADGSDIGAYEVQAPAEPVTAIEPAAEERPDCRGLAATIQGTDEGEILRGTGEIDVIVAGSGDDVIHGGTGNDVVCGGPGKDRANGGSGFDKLEGQGGPDVLKGGTGRDKLFGQKGKDVLRGQRGKDTCAGGKNRDTASDCEVEVSV